MPMIGEGTIFPNYEAIDLTRKEVIVNMCLIAELAQRSENKQPLLTNIEDYAQMISRRVEIDPPDFMGGSE